MNKVMKFASLLVLSLFALSLAPSGASAQAAVSETITVQINATTPAGTRIIGTAVAKRRCGAATLTDLMFNGTINGLPASAAATATERWSSNSVGELTVNEPTEWNMASLGKPDGLTLNVVQTAPGLITVNGVPMAIDGDLMSPCGGRTTYLVTNPGQGATQVVFLPRTGDGPLALHPLVIVGMMLVPGLFMIMLSTVLHKVAVKRNAR